MGITVCKFGGTSLADAGMFIRVKRILDSDPDRRYIVLSAPGKRFADDEKITDLLYRYHQSQFSDDTILSRIFMRYARIRDALAPDFNLEAEFAQLRGCAVISADFAASRGEYLCARLFSAFAEIPFVDAARLFILDTQGRVDMERTKAAVQSILGPMQCAVIPGFYAATPDGQIKTFSRGGSDVSGALAAAALQADLYENWSDVDGLFTGDPAQIPGVRRHAKVSYRQMEAIAAAGAQLMHPDALAPLRGSGIDVLLKNSFNPGAEGTRITEACNDIVSCVTARKAYFMPDSINNSDSCALLHSLPVPGSISVCVVSVFGLTHEKQADLQHTLQPIHTIHMRDHLEIIMPESQRAEALRAVHALLK